ncbi:hypothetical protein KUTeg_017788 [Tegillarca granosa]|uniref:Uncharacterized protein n=1 Tax=Tegillarca granosa TaxID=220873 RepID=A0ABQ9EG77_TEGGR|nr:hypothetical protein KUTeg_017788 [Tegillarca granosa]
MLGIVNKYRYLDIWKKKSVKLASHVLQLVFLGLTGFRFSVANLLPNIASASELYLVLYISMDWAQSNKHLMNILLNRKTSDTITSMIVDWAQSNKHLMNMLLNR